MTTLDDTLRPGLGKRFGRLAALNIAANLTVPLAGLVDTGMLGHLPEIRFLAGVALASVLFDYVYWTFGFLRMGTTGTTAQAAGRGDGREVFLTLYRGLAMGAGIGLAIVLVQYPLRELGFAALQGGEAVKAAGRAYFDARIWAAPATLSNFVLVGWFLGREESGRALVMTLVANLGNIALDYLFIVHLGMAAFGAGLATALSQLLMLGAGLWILFAGCAPVRPRMSQIFDPHRLASLVRLNRDILVRTLCLVSAFAAFTNLSALLGEVSLAANSILLRILALASYLVDGAAFAIESLAGVLHGAGDRAGLGRVLRLGLGTGLAFSAAIAAVLLTAPGPALGLLTSHAEVIAVARGAAGWLAAVLLVGSNAYVLDGFFLGLTRGRTLRSSMLLSLFLGFVPLAAAAGLTSSNRLLWLALLAFMAARTVSLGVPARAVLRPRPGAGPTDPVRE